MLHPPGGLLRSSWSSSWLVEAAVLYRRHGWLAYSRFDGRWENFIKKVPVIMQARLWGKNIRQCFPRSHLMLPAARGALSGEAENLALWVSLHLDKVTHRFIGDIIVRFYNTRLNRPF